jgi:arylsulfatase A-like enzyme
MRGSGMQKRMQDKLVLVVKRNQLVYKIARYLYTQYNKFRSRRDYYSRIKKLNAVDYLDGSSTPGLNVIMLVIDCLRGSQLSCRGYPRETTPFLDTLGSKFRAISASCWTHPAVASLLTGLYPHNHNAVIGGKIKNFDHLENLYTIRKQIVTLPEILSLSGYRVYFGTAINMAAYPLKGRGIPELHERPVSADELMTDLTGWISKKSSPFFAYLQLGDLHEPLYPPHNFRNFFGNVKALPKIDRWNFGKPEMQQGAQFQEYKENRILLYDNTLRYVDHAIEKFYATLKDIGLIDSTILIITADHGEEFWEHASLEAENFYDPRGCCGVGHGHNVFNEIIEIPLLISAPGVPDGQSMRLVSMVDIMPTVLDLLEVKHKLKFDGQNILGKQESETPLLSEASGFGYEKKALIIGRFKLIYSQDDAVAWVFDLEKDPQELHPIKDQGVVSMFIDKLSEIQKRGKKRRIREIIEEKNLANL